MSRLVVLVVLLAACGAPEPPAVKGKPEDVLTRAGDHGGFEVVVPCSERGEIGVRGKGARWYLGVGPGQPGRGDALYAFVTREIYPVVRPLPAFVAIAYGRACGSLGVKVSVDDWRVVDSAIAVVGVVLAEQRLAETVAIEVFPRLAPADAP